MSGTVARLSAIIHSSGTQRRTWSTSASGVKCLQQQPLAQDLDQLADEEVERLKQEMIAAADDVELKARGQPATEKLRVLPQVVAMLQK